MKTSYLITSDKFTGSILYEYEDGLLCKLELSKDLKVTEEQRLFLLSRTRIKEAEVDKWENISGVKITKCLQDLTFEPFWKLYNYKVGAKTKTRDIWNKLKEEEKILALDFIDENHAFKKASGQALLYPERYLKYKVWEK